MKMDWQFLGIAKIMNIVFAENFSLDDWWLIIGFLMMFSSYKMTYHHIKLS